MKPSTVEWLDFAKADLLGARVHAEPTNLKNLVLFHCHQAWRRSVRKP